MISHAALRAALSLPNSQQDARYWAIRWQYFKGDGFFDEMCRAAAHADLENLARIQRGFPELALAVYFWKNMDGWAQATEAWAESLVPLQEEPREGSRKHGSAHPEVIAGSTDRSSTSASGGVQS